MIVFAHFRKSVDEIKTYLLKRTNALIKAEIFCGQGGENGLTQKDQAVLIENFK